MHTQSKHELLVQEMSEKYPSINLPSEYSYFIQDNQLRLLIRLARYKFVARLLKPSDRVLEVGCGSGLGAMFLAQHCKSVQGIDTNSAEINDAIRINRRNNVTFQCANFTELHEHQYDVVVALDVIEHLSAEDGQRLIDRTRMFLNETGMLIIGTPSIYSFEYQGALSKAAHIKLYDQQEYLDMVDNYYARTLPFSMNDEIVHTGFSKMAWYYFFLSFLPNAIK